MENGVMILNSDGNWSEMSVEDILKDLESVLNTDVSLEDN